MKMKTKNKATLRATATLGLIVLSALTVGCASIVNDSTHPVRLDAMKAGASVANVDCSATNDYGTTNFKSGATFQARRSSKDMDIVCNSAEHGVAKGRAISRVNGGMFGNILLGGGVGAIIDHNKGTAYTYPTWMRLTFGQDEIFDRSDEKEGFPVQGRTLGTVGAPTPVSAATPASAQ